MNGTILRIDAEDFKKEVLESAKPVVVDFYWEGCAPCEALTPIFERLAEKYARHIKFVKILRQENGELVRSLGIASSPTLLFYKGGKEAGSRLNGFLSKPQVRKAIEETLGDALPAEEMKRADCDVLVLGAGAAGLSAALYAARAKMYTVIVDESVPGGLAASTYRIANYPGTPGVIRGRELAKNMEEQARFFGARIDDLKEIFEVRLQGKTKYVRTEDTEYYAKALVIATGETPRPLPAEGAEEFKGRGVHYCATCDGSMYEGRKVIVVGGGDSAVEEAVFLTRYASSVTVIHQFGSFQASKAAQEEAFKNGRIDVIWDSEVRRINAENGALTGVVAENIKTGELSEVPAEGVFVYIGRQPKSELFRGQVDMDEQGCVKTDEGMRTSVDGVFAAGDIRPKAVRQVVTAAADGAIAGINAERYVTANYM